MGAHCPYCKMYIEEHRKGCPNAARGGVIVDNVKVWGILDSAYGPDRWVGQEKIKYHPFWSLEKDDTGLQAEVWEINRLRDTDKWVQILEMPDEFVAGYPEIAKAAIRLTQMRYWDEQITLLQQTKAVQESVPNEVHNWSVIVEGVQGSFEFQSVEPIPESAKEFLRSLDCPFTVEVRRACQGKDLFADLKGDTNG